MRDGMNTGEPMGHISSAVLRVANGREADVTEAVRAMGCEVALTQDTRLIVLMEGPSSGAIGALLTEMNLLDGVHSACMVYEHAEPLGILGEDV